MYSSLSGEHNRKKLLPQIMMDTRDRLEEVGKIFMRTNCHFKEDGSN
jgi:hypothetical protein